MSSTSLENFIFFGGNLKLWWIFEEKAKKIDIKYGIQNKFKQSKSFNTGVYYGVEHHGVNRIYVTLETW